MKCYKCETDTFNVEIICDCSKCEQNGWEDPEDNTDGWQRGPIPEGSGFERLEAIEDGQCGLGNAFGEGCWKVTCTKCGKEDHLALVSS